MRKVTCVAVLCLGIWGRADLCAGDDARLFDIEGVTHHLTFTELKIRSNIRQLGAPRSRDRKVRTDTYSRCLTLSGLLASYDDMRVRAAEQVAYLEAGGKIRVEPVYLRKDMRIIRPRKLSKKTLMKKYQGVWNTLRAHLNEDHGEEYRLVEMYGCYVPPSGERRGE